MKIFRHVLVLVLLASAPLWVTVATGASTSQSLSATVIPVLRWNGDQLVGSNSATAVETLRIAGKTVTVAIGYQQPD